MPLEDERGEHEQFEIGLFMDLSQLDELERKVVGVIQRLEELRAQNSDLRDTISALKGDIRTKTEENDRLVRERDGLLHNQRDEKKESLIRKKLEELLKKLENY